MFFEHSQNQINIFLIHGLSAIGARIDMAMLTGLIALVAQVNL
jgi:hypothetical protein